MGYVQKTGFALLVAATMTQAPAMARDYSPNGQSGYERQRSGRDVSGHEVRRRAMDGNYRLFLHKNPNYRAATPSVVERPVQVASYQASTGWQAGTPYNGTGYAPTYVVQDYRVHGLNAPPRNHYWRRSEVGDFLLVAAATDMITDLVLKR